MHKKALWTVFLLLFPLTLIVVTFSSAAHGYTITPSASVDGAVVGAEELSSYISPSNGVTIADGGSRTFNVLLQPGKVLEGLYVDGSDTSEEECLADEPTDCWVPTQYTFTNVTSDHTIVAVFSDAAGATANTITSSATVDGAIFPDGPVGVSDGGSQTFNILIPAGKVLEGLYVDGSDTSEEECLADEPTDCWVPTQYTFTNVTSDHTIVAVFSDAAGATANTITSSATVDGAIFPDGPVGVSDGGSQTFNILIPAGKVLEGLYVDGSDTSEEECLADEPTDCWVPTRYTFTNVTSDHTIVAVFSDAAGATANTITSSATVDGAIFPDGPVGVSDGGSQTFNILIPAGKVLEGLYVDGSDTSEEECLADEPTDCWVPTRYTFTNVTSDHTIVAVFSDAAGATANTITSSATVDGAIFPDGPVGVSDGGSQTFNILIPAGKVLEGLYVDGSDTSEEECLADEPTDCWVPTRYTFTNVTSDHTIVAVFSDAAGATANTITSSATVDGAIFPDGPVGVSDGGSQTFNILIPAGKVLEGLYVDGSDTSEEECLADEPTDCWVPTRYTFTNVTSDHTIVAVFSDAATITTTGYTIDASFSVGGQLSSEGPAAVPAGSSKTFTAVADLGYELTELVVDENPVEECLVDEPNDCWVPTQYTFTNVTDNSHSIVATFTLVYLPNPVILESDQINYTSIQTAYNSIPDEGSDTIKVKAGEQTGYLVFNRDVTARIEGGYDSTLSNVVSYTNLYGTITISAGTVIISNLIY